MVFYVSSRLRMGHFFLWLSVIGLGMQLIVNNYKSVEKRWSPLCYLLIGIAFSPGIHMLLEKPLDYVPDMQEIKVCWLYNDLGEYDKAKEMASAIKNPIKQRLMLNKIEELRNQSESEREPLHLLSQVIPKRYPSKE